MLPLFRKLLLKLPRRSFLIGISTKQRRSVERFAGAFAITIFSILILFKSATYSAEIIKFNYSLLGFKIEVADLELFTEQGVITDRLNFYLKRISPKQKERLQRFFKQSYDVNPVLVYRFSRTSVGIKMLNRLGEIIKIPEDINGFYGLRAALINSAATDEGVSFISFLKQFPTDIKLDLAEVLELVKQISNSEQASKGFISSLKQSEHTISTKNTVKDVPDLSNLGKIKTSVETIEFYDRERERTLITDFYFPPNTTGKIPLIVISNGLGANRKRFAELANYLTSYGFAVAVPEHPGSNSQRQQEFIKGLHQENFDATDFIDRPLDISFILDELTIINQERFNNQIDLENVGIFGYSIGGTTAFSLAGADIDYDQLKEDCDRPLDLTNISILYQCRALEIESRQVSLQDNRIKAAFLFVPFGKSLFSEEELSKVQIPMIWQVVDRDFLTSLTKEQLPVYNALKNSDRYLVVSEKLPHSTAILSKQRSASQQNESRLGRKYQNILSLVFFKQYLTKNQQYGEYLNNNFVQAISEAPYTLHLTKEIPQSNELESN